MMKQKSMTALVSAFSRAYHSANNAVKVFDDSMAEKILTAEEYLEISCNMAKGIGFFNPGFVGNQEEALRWVVDNQLSPSPIGRAAFAEKALETAVKNGASQYLIFAAGYDTFAYRQPRWGSAIRIFEMDHPATGADKKQRLEEAKIAIPSNAHYMSADLNEDEWVRDLTGCGYFSRDEISFCSLLGISYYLSKKTFEQTIKSISGFIPKGSGIVFDYPDEVFYTDKAGERAQKQATMARMANEKMLASYSCGEMENLLVQNGFLVREHLKPAEITERYFKSYNKVNPGHAIAAFDNVNYCLAVRS